MGNGGGAGGIAKGDDECDAGSTKGGFSPVSVGPPKLGGGEEKRLAALRLASGDSGCDELVGGGVGMGGGGTGSGSIAPSGLSAGPGADCGAGLDATTLRLGEPIGESGAPESVDAPGGTVLERSARLAADGVTGAGDVGDIPAVKLARLDIGWLIDGAGVEVACAGAGAAAGAGAGAGAAAVGPGFVILSAI